MTLESLWMHSIREIQSQLLGTSRSKPPRQLQEPPEVTGETKT